MVSNSARESGEEQQAAAYYRAAAARARNLVAEATTPRAKQHLRDLIDQCERAAEEAEEASRNLR